MVGVGACLLRATVTVDWTTVTLSNAVSRELDSSDAKMLWGWKNVELANSTPTPVVEGGIRGSGCVTSHGTCANHM